MLFPLGWWSDRKLQFALIVSFGESRVSKNVGPTILLQLVGWLSFFKITRTASSPFFQVRFALFPCVKLLLKLCGSVVVVVVVVWKSSRGAYRCFERVFVSEVGAIIILLLLETDFPSDRSFFWLILRYHFASLPCETTVEALRVYCCRLKEFHGLFLSFLWELMFVSDVGAIIIL